MYRTMKVFDSYCGMPEHIRTTAKNQFEIDTNSTYRYHTVQSPTIWDEADDGSEVITENESYTELDKWLISEAYCYSDELVLILY